MRDQGKPPAKLGTPGKATHARIGKRQVIGAAFTLKDCAARGSSQ
jgi:hypothetical protein